MKICTMLFVFYVCMPLTIFSAFAGVPPEYVEPTRSEMKSLGFKFAITKDNVGSSLDWRYPKHVRNQHSSLGPSTTEVTVKNTAGKVIARITNSVSSTEFMALSTSFDHKVSDVSVSVTYACTNKSRSKNGCYGATTYSIPSVSKFIAANPDALNLRPKCRKVTEMVIDCTKYESAEHP